MFKELAQEKRLKGYNCAQADSVSLPMCAGLMKEQHIEWLRGYSSGIGRRREPVVLLPVW